MKNDRSCALCARARAHNIWSNLYYGERKKPTDTHTQTNYTHLKNSLNAYLICTNRRRTAISHLVYWYSFFNTSTLNYIPNSVCFYHFFFSFFACAKSMKNGFCCFCFIPRIVSNRFTHLLWLLFSSLFSSDTPINIHREVLRFYFAQVQSRCVHMRFLPPPNNQKCHYTENP